MNKGSKAALCVLAWAALLFGSFCAFSHAVYGRSAAATAVELSARDDPRANADRGGNA